MSTSHRTRARTSTSTILGGATALLALVALVATAPPARADTPIASYSTATCSSGIGWRILYRLYFTDSAGRATTRDALPSVLDLAQQFAANVGVDSACNARMQIDVHDMGDTPWPASASTPTDINAAIDAGGYDAAFVRYPLQDGETYAGRTYLSDPDHFVSGFPVDAAGVQVHCGGCSTDPNTGLMEHEWMHQVVAFYEPAQGWPADDVHGGHAHGYCESSTFCSQVYRPYFAAMMQGTVIENGHATGLLAADWLRDGRPAAPLRPAAPTWTTTLLRGSGADPDELELEIPAAYDGSALITVSKDDVPVARTTHAAGAFRFAADADGRYQVCAQLPGTPRFRASALLCSRTYTLEGPRCSVPQLKGSTVRAARARLIARGCTLGQVKARLLTLEERRQGVVPDRLDGTFARNGVRYHWFASSRFPLGAKIDVRLILDACHVPQLKGMTIVQARRSLKRRGCRLGRVHDRAHHAGRPGRIVGQSLHAGRTLRAGRRIDVSRVAPS